MHPSITLGQGITWIVAVAAIVGMLLRPRGWPEAVWAVAGALLLVMFAVEPTRAALDAVARGNDVYLFLAGMMMLAETARRERLFDWIAARAARWARGSASRLFALVYGVGTVTTVFLSNDATAVVLTPAVYAATQAARAPALPYLYACAFIANAASFVLPVSNPANIVVFGEQLPPLAGWFARFALPSLASIVATYVVLRWHQRASLRAPLATDVTVRRLDRGGRIAAGGIAVSAAILLAASAGGMRLGMPTFAVGIATLAAVSFGDRAVAGAVLRGIAWSILPLVAGLFVLVDALARTGAIAALAATLARAVQWSVAGASWLSGIGIALACNLVNNLPAGVVAASTVSADHVPEEVVSALLIGVDLGPNLSVTGSLATILWLTALRREGESVSAMAFLRVGAWVMPPALLLALAAVVLPGLLH
jgi:arsenical pump membrane protein